MLLGLIIRKLGYGLLVITGVVLVVFFLFQGLGDPSRLVMGQTGDAATRKAIREELNLDQPRWKQFLYYLNDISPLAVHSREAIRTKHLKGFFVGGSTCVGLKVPYLRRSYQTRQEVGSMLMRALPGTLLLAGAAMLVAILLGIPLGVAAAVRPHSWLDTGSMVASIAGISAPSFFIGIIIAYVFGFLLSRYTGLHITGNWYGVDELTGARHLTLQNLVLPALTLGIRPLAIIAQLTRSAMVEVLDQDYIRTAYAKGLSRRRVIWQHALRNALNPVVTAVTGWFAELLAGAFFVEYIFGWQGIGKVTVDALEKLDFPVVMGSVLVTAVFFILVNMLADILYGLIDPRVRVG
ncbi:MAG TPA: ABC transporter permease [Chitinophagaceae bacterium]|nr:ABC transporter permease [Chitinophagaceae bacterium]